ncbi:MAG: indole-3-glycerol-phosphate synthase [Candidatus Dormibacteraeota bacterium]|nr:indole-3-glycerol-phosphate synthase [Candidatus Dormibacteraeota bacterium]MBV9526121.1 indole-3-glycerol-phosphate synthase [Candidatus Dormibacteraeota bacterium]
MSEGLGALASIAARKALEAERLRCAGAGMWAKAEALPAARDMAVLRGGAVIAEMKRRSPSGGELRSALDPVSLAREYQAGGAAALSVLTDGPSFGGSLDDLHAVRAVADIPLLRKDFVLDPVQVAEARVAGADWVLLIVALLDSALLDECLDAVRRCGAHALVEGHDADEVRRAVDAGAECVGINNRDLRTLTVDLGTFSRLRPLVPDGVICVAESGVRSPDDARRMVSEGADAVLVGEAMLRAESPGAACGELAQAARAAAGTQP